MCQGAPARFCAKVTRVRCERDLRAAQRELAMLDAARGLPGVVQLWRGGAGCPAPAARARVCGPRLRRPVLRDRDAVRRLAESLSCLVLSRCSILGTSVAVAHWLELRWVSQQICKRSSAMRSDPRGGRARLVYGAEETSLPDSEGECTPKQSACGESALRSERSALSA